MHHFILIPCSSVNTIYSDMNMAASFDCGRLSNKVFQISQGDIKQPGVGMDESTELSGYLQGTLLKIDEASNQSKSCIPGHADPDGHCLVHAISRCLTGMSFKYDAP